MIEKGMASMPNNITGDPFWNLETYRLALFMPEIAWPDTIAISKNPLTCNPKIPAP